MTTDNSDILLESNLANLVHRGKVRDTHTIDEKTLLMVSTDRISAYDVAVSYTNMTLQPTPYV